MNIKWLLKNIVRGFLGLVIVMLILAALINIKSRDVRGSGGDWFEVTSLKLASGDIWEVTLSEHSPALVSASMLTTNKLVPGDFVKVRSHALENPTNPSHQHDYVSFVTGWKRGEGK